MNQQTHNPENTSSAQRILDDIVKRIVESVHPEKIIFLGSAARGEVDPRGRVPVFVVIDLPDISDRHKFEGQLYTALRGPIAVDALVVTPGDIKRLTRKQSMEESKTVYEAP